MRIIEFHIRNFKSINDLTLRELGSFNIIVGKNNTGKSTILDALQTFIEAMNSGVIKNQDDHVWPLGKPSKEPIEFDATVELTKGELSRENLKYVERITDFETNAFTLVDVQVCYQKKMSNPIRISMESKLNRRGESISKQDVESELLGYIRTHLNRCKRIDVIRGQVPQPPGEARQGMRGALIPQGTITALRSWINSRQAVHSEKFEMVNHIFRGLTGKRWNLRLEGEYLCLEDGEYTAEVNALGGGIQEMIHLAYELVDSPFVLMIEEPETHAHPEQTKRVYDILRSLTGNHLIFVTTHSTVFAEHARFSEVYQVYKENSHTNCRKITDSEFTIVANDLGLRPADVFMVSALVFVEGECDQIALKAWAELIGESLDSPIAGIVKMDGMGKARHIASVWKGVIERINLPLVWVFDADAPDRIVEELVGQGARRESVIRLKDGSIEDYYPISPFLKHLISSWGLDDEKGRKLGSILSSHPNSARITEFLQREGDPQPTKSEWKKPAARFIANQTSITDYSESELKRISNLIIQVKTAINKAI